MHPAYRLFGREIRGQGEALIIDLRINAPHVKCSVVMPGQIGTSIRANTRKIHSGDRESDAVALARWLKSRTGRHRFPPVIIQHAVWLYPRFTLSYRDVEELLAERGLDNSYEAIRYWVLKFGPVIARRPRRCRPRPSHRWHLDEMVVRIAGERMYLWRAVDHEGEVLDILVQRRRHTRGGAATDAQAAEEARLRAQIAGHRQAALLRLRVPAPATDLPACPHERVFLVVRIEGDGLLGHQDTQDVQARAWNQPQLIGDWR
jgi:hypothetical protein